MTVNNFKPVQAQNFSLAGGGAVAGATSIILKSFAQIDGTLLTMTDFGSIGFITLEPGNGTLEEQISFTGVTQNSNGTATLTGVSTVLMVSPYTASSGLAQTHAGSTSAVVSNTSGYYDQFPKKAVDATISGKYTFPNDDVSNAGIASDTDTAVATAFVTLGQLSRQAISGASNASTTVKGIVQLPTQTQVDAKTTTGSTGALLALTPDKQRSVLLSDYVADTGAADAYVITPSPAISAYTTGQRFSFKVANTNATTTPTIAVNGLTAKTIVKRGTAAMAAGDLLATQIVEIEYDGTNFQLMSPVATAPATSAALTAAIKFGGTGADGALSITSGATNINLANASVVVKNYTTISITGTGSLTFTNPATNGTLVILKATGNVTLTSSTAPMIVASSLGGGGGAGGASSDNAGTAGSVGKNAFRIMYAGSGGGAGAGATTNGASATTTQGSIALGTETVASKAVRIFTGSGGGGGGSGTASGGTGGAGGAGGRGGGALYIECGGALNFTTSAGISVAGAAGTAGSAGVTSNAGGGGGGGGGAGGSCVVLYNTLTASSGTITVTGGAGGAGAAGAAGGTPGSGGAAGNGSSGAGIGAAGGAGGDAGSGSKGAGGGAGGGSDDGLSNGSAGTGGQGGSAAAGGAGGGASGYSLVTANVDFA